MTWKDIRVLACLDCKEYVNVIPDDADNQIRLNFFTFQHPKHRLQVLAKNELFKKNYKCMDYEPSKLNKL